MAQKNITVHVCPICNTERTLGVSGNYCRNDECKDENGRYQRLIKQTRERARRYGTWRVTGNLHSGSSGGYTQVELINTENGEKCWVWIYELIKHLGSPEGGAELGGLTLEETGKGWGGFIPV